ncbi:MAG TPA: histidine kinase [Solirubrobacteraceae bacterium]|nr:histidine kinase [Solirubrobacteraceae bacterium]
MSTTARTQARLAERRVSRRARLAPLGWALVAIVAFATIATHPTPGLRGAGLGVGVALVGYVVVFGAAIRASTSERTAMPGTSERTAMPGTSGRTEQQSVRVIVATGVLLALCTVGLLASQPDGPAELAAGGTVWMAVSRLPNRIGIGLAVASTVACDATIAVAQSSLEDVASMSLLCALLGLTGLFMRDSAASEERAELLLAELEDAREAQLEAAAIAERGRIAGELHDVLAHSLSGLAIQLEGGRKLAEREDVDPALQDVLARSAALAREGLFDARQAVGALRGSQPPAEDELGRLVESFRRDLHHEATLTVTGGVRRLDPAIGLALYRAAQEALTNAARYAPRTPTAVRLGYRPDAVCLTVENDAPAAAEGGDQQRSVGGGNGLAGMRERIEGVGGVMRAGPTATGWSVEVEIPR